MFSKKGIFKSYLELSFAQFCIGANIILGKTLMDFFNLYWLLLVRFSFAFILSGLYLLITKRQTTIQEYKTLSKQDWLILFGQALCGGFLFNIFILYGMQHTTATVAGIINSAVPAFVAIFCFFLLKEKLTVNKGLAIILCIIGINILGLNGTESATDATNTNLWGMFLILMAVVPEAFYTILAKLLKTRISPLFNSFLMNLFNALLFLPFAVGEQNLISIDTSFINVVQILAYSLTTMMFFLFWQRGVALVSANTAALFMGVMPISTTLLACLFLDETLVLFDMLGMLCVLSSIFWGAKVSSTTITT